MSKEERPKKLSFRLEADQLEALRPLLEANGQVKLAGTLRENEFTVSFIACNAAFLACNAAFRVGGAEQQ